MEINITNIIIVLQFFGLIIVAIAALRSGRNLDKELSDRLERSASPETQQQLHEAFKKSDENVKQLIQITAAVLRFVAPLTPGVKFDDTAAKFLTDIQQEPAPVSPPVAPSVG